LAANISAPRRRRGLQSLGIEGHADCLVVGLVLDPVVRIVERFSGEQIECQGWMTHQVRRPVERLEQFFARHGRSLPDLASHEEA
jgi:hypothetical protein